METKATHHSPEAYKGASEPQQFPPLELVNRPTVPTSQAAYYVNRRPQTLRGWAMNTGTGPISPIRVNGRLAWSVADIKRVMGVL